MARKTTTLTIPAGDDNRDAGKKFLITEMSAAKAERWATRGFLKLAKSGIDIGDIGATPSMAAIAVLGFRALGKLDPEDLEPLLDEMFTCVQYVPELEGAPLQAIRDGDNSQIEEVTTRLAIRKAVFELHTGFSLAG